MTLTLFGPVTTAGLWIGGLAVMMGRLPQRVIIVGLVLFNTALTTIPINKRLCKPLIARALCQKLNNLFFEKSIDFWSQWCYTIIVPREGALNPGAMEGSQHLPCEYQRMFVGDFVR